MTVKTDDPTKPKKILVYDVERSTMDLLIRTYDLKNHQRYFNHRDIVRDWVMLGAAWKFLGDDKISCVSVSHRDPFNDYEPVKRLHAALSSADVLIGHNADRFDIRVFNTRAIMYDLPPIEKKLQIDTLKLSRKYFYFSSNSLSFICNRLDLGGKDEQPDWEAILAGDKHALAFMRDYNRNDVILTEKLYLRIRGYHHTHPDISSVTRDIEGCAIIKCPRCDSADVIKYSRRAVIRAGQAAGYKQRYLCKDCNYTFRGGMIK